MHTHLVIVHECMYSETSVTWLPFRVTNFVSVNEVIKYTLGMFETYLKRSF